MKRFPRAALVGIALVLVAGCGAPSDGIPLLVRSGAPQSEPVLPSVLCSGVYLADDHLLTAGHCVSPTDSFEVIPDVKDRCSAAREDPVGVEEVALAPSGADLALLTLPNADVDGVSTIGDRPQSGDLVSAQVWTGGGPARCVLERVEFRVLEDTSCSQMLGEESPRFDPARMFCALPITQSACGGDSGSGIWDPSGELVGVVSWGVGCEQGSVEIFADLSAVGDWLSDRIDGLQVPVPTLTPP